MMRIAVLATNRNPLVAPFAGGREALTAALVGGFVDAVITSSCTLRRELPLRWQTR